MVNLDLLSIEDRLVSVSKETIIRFSTEHPDEPCSFFAYDVDRPWFLLSFDTPANAMKVAKQTEQEALARRAKSLSGPNAWMGAKFELTYPPILDYSYSTGYFSYSLFHEVKIDELEDIEFSDDYPRHERFEDYAVAITRILLWRVIERLVEGDVFGSLHLALPFRLGYQMHDDSLTVLRILNWPQLSGAH